LDGGFEIALRFVAPSFGQANFDLGRIFGSLRGFCRFRCLL
jgi:hypothetical protein